jgi:hypothetical protein
VESSYGVCRKLDSSVDEIGASAGTGILDARALSRSACS